MPRNLAANVLAPARHHVQSFHVMGITHHFTPTQGSWILGLVLAAAVVSLLGLRKLFS